MSILERFTRCLVPGTARRLVSLLLLAQKKGTKDNEVSVQANLQVTPELKRHPIPPPLRGTLHCSPSRAAAELGLRPQTVLADFPRLGSATRRRKRGMTKNQIQNRTPCPGKARSGQGKTTRATRVTSRSLKFPLLRRFV